MKELELEELKKLYYGQLPIENAKESRSGWEHLPDNYFNDISPGSFLLEYLIGVVEELPDEHNWAAFHLKQRLQSYYAGQNLDKALGIKRLTDPRAWRNRYAKIKGLSVGARIVLYVENYDGPIDEYAFENVSDRINNEGNKIRLTLGTTREIYYGDSKKGTVGAKDDPKIEEEIKKYFSV